MATECGDGRLGRPAMAKPSSGRFPFESRRTKNEYQGRREMRRCSSPKWKCGRASHPTAFVRDFLLCQITAWRRNDRFGRQRSRSHEQQVPPLPKRVAHSQSRDHELASLRWPAVRPALCSEEQRTGGGGGRNARATSRTCARFLECPPVIHPRESPGCRWLCRNHSASSGNFTFR